MASQRCSITSHLFGFVWVSFGLLALGGSQIGFAPRWWLCYGLVWLGGRLWCRGGGQDCAVNVDGFDGDSSAPLVATCGGLYLERRVMYRWSYEGPTAALRLVER